MMNNSDIILYIKKVKEFIENDEEARGFFYHKHNEDDFFNMVTVVAEKNIESNGIPDLTLEQFENIRKSLYYNVGNTDVTKNIVENLNLYLN